MRKATSVEHVRCAQCRNPIRGRQASVLHARAAMSFHADCWASLHDSVQREYLERVEEHGIEALVEPYRRGDMASWLPAAAIEAAAAELTEALGTVAS